MRLVYGDGNASVDHDIQGFEIKFRGAIHLQNSDNWIIGVNNNKIIGVHLGGGASGDLFTYTGELIIKSATYVADNTIYNLQTEVQGVDYWNLDDQNWEDDKSLWGSADKT